MALTLGNSNRWNQKCYFAIRCLVLPGALLSVLGQSGFSKPLPVPTPEHTCSRQLRVRAARGRRGSCLPEAGLASGTALLELDPAWRPVPRWWGTLTELFSSLFGEGIWLEGGGSIMASLVCKEGPEDRWVGVCLSTKDTDLETQR